METNMVAEVLGWELSSDSIDSLTESPDSESNGIVSFPFQINYTFTNLATQAFIGTELMDLARFDMVQQLGIRHQVGSFGIFQAGVLFTGVVAEVWSDPYVTGQPRSKTDRDSSGARLVWGNIMDSNFDFTYTFRTTDIDDERSGVALGLSPSDRALLDRDGDKHDLEIIYTFDLTGPHRLTPAFTYLFDDTDGGAMESDQYAFQLTYSYVGADPFSLTLNGMLGWADYDRANPIPAFNGRTQEDDMYALNATIYYKNPWGWTLAGSQPIHFYVEGAWFERDSDIDFYDEKLTMVSTGAMFRW
jgi:hypothetical protein